MVEINGKTILEHNESFLGKKIDVLGNVAYRLMGCEKVIGFQDLRRHRVRAGRCTAPL